MLLIAVLASPIDTEASVKGIDMWYDCIGSCSVRVHQRVYLDCSGTPSSALFSNFAFTAQTPGCSTPTLIGSSTTSTFSEITPLCPSTSSNCSLPGGIPGITLEEGYRDYSYCGGATGCIFTLNFSACCRDPQTSSISGTPHLRVNSTTLNTQLSVCNNSPAFASPNNMVACAGQPFQFDLGAYDIDGDVLTYSLGPCYDSTLFQQIPYAGGFSSTQPLGSSWNVQLDSETGNILFVPTPGNIATAVVCVYIEERRGGVLINTYVRDLFIGMDSCSSNFSPRFSGYQNVQGGALVGIDHFEVCQGSTLSFDAAVTDLDPGQTVTYYWDGHIASASFTETGNASVMDTIAGTNPSGHFAFTPTAPGRYAFLLTAKDNHCPLVAQTEKLVLITVPEVLTLSSTPGTQLNPCLGLDSLQITASASSNAQYIWSNGDTTPQISITQPGTYTTTVSNPGGCQQIDSITIGITGTSLYGTITSSTQVPLANQKVYLVNYNSFQGTLTGVDTTLTDGNGFYYFCGLNTIASYFVKAAPDSLDFPLELPTYALSSLVWNQATPFYPATLGPTQVDFSTQPGMNPGGPGFIGGLISQGANKNAGLGDPVEGVRIFCYHIEGQAILGYADSDANGYLSFGNLPIGTYKLIPDRPGVDHLDVPVATVTTSNMHQDSMALSLFPTFLEWKTITATDPEAAPFMAAIGPNPASSSTQIHLDLPQEGRVSISLRDVQGRNLGHLKKGILPAGKHRLPWNPELSPGTYFVEIQYDRQCATLRLMIQ